MILGVSSSVRGLQKGIAADAAAASNFGARNRLAPRASASIDTSSICPEGIRVRPALPALLVRGSRRESEEDEVLAHRAQAEPKLRKPRTPTVL
jgi:hypothetical protein